MRKLFSLLAILFIALTSIPSAHAVIQVLEVDETSSSSSSSTYVGVDTTNDTNGCGLNGYKSGSTCVCYAGYSGSSCQYKDAAVATAAFNSRCKNTLPFTNGVQAWDKMGLLATKTGTCHKWVIENCKSGYTTSGVGTSAVCVVNKPTCSTMQYYNSSTNTCVSCPNYASRSSGGTDTTCNICVSGWYTHSTTTGGHYKCAKKCTTSEKLVWGGSYPTQTSCTACPSGSTSSGGFDETCEENLGDTNCSTTQYYRKGTTCGYCPYASRSNGGTNTVCNSCASGWVKTDTLDGGHYKCEKSCSTSQYITYSRYSSSSTYPEVTACNTCPTGYLSAGGQSTSCDRKVYCSGVSSITTDPNSTASTDYLNGSCFAKKATACVTGYKVSGTGCEKSLCSGYAAPANSTASTDYLNGTCYAKKATACAVGYKVSGTGCEKNLCSGYANPSNSTSSIDYLTGTCFTKKATACEAGYQISGTGCAKVYCSGASATSLPSYATKAKDVLHGSCFIRAPETCAAGYHIEEGSCEKSICSGSVKPANSTTSLEYLNGTCYAIKATACVAGYTVSGTGCVQVTCPDGKKVSGSTCVDVICEANQLRVGTGCQSCPAGYVGTKGTSTVCQTKITKSGNLSYAASTEEKLFGTEFWTIVKSCQAGYSLVNPSQTTAKCEKKSCSGVSRDSNGVSFTEIANESCFLAIPTVCKDGYVLEKQGTKDAYCKQNIKNAGVTYPNATQTNTILSGNAFYIVPTQCKVKFALKNANTSSAQCVPLSCAKNEYIDGNDCKSCKSGYYSEGKDVMACTKIEAPVNHYFDVNSQTYQKCPSGQMSKGGNITSCGSLSCDDHEMIDGNGCKACPSGQTHSSDHKSCKDIVCSKNQYVKEHVCSACAKDFYNVADNKETTCKAIQAEVNYFFNTTKQIYEECSADKSSKGGAATSCDTVKCSANQFVKDHGCSDCEDGYISKGGTVNSCTKNEQKGDLDNVKKTKVILVKEDRAFVEIAEECKPGFKLSNADKKNAKCGKQSEKGNYVDGEGVKDTTEVVIGDVFVEVPSECDKGWKLEDKETKKARCEKDYCSGSSKDANATKYNEVLEGSCFAFESTSCKKGYKIFEIDGVDRCADQCNVKFDASGVDKFDFKFDSSKKCYIPYATKCKSDHDLDDGECKKGSSGHSRGKR